MPLFRMKCPCGHEYDALTTIADANLDTCPECGHANKERAPVQFAVHSDGRDRRPEDYPAEELQLIMENKASLEADSERILSGALGISERGPDWSRPKCPEHLKKRYF